MTTSSDLGAGAGHTASAKASSGSASDLPPPSERGELVERLDKAAWVAKFHDRAEAPLFKDAYAALLSAEAQITALKAELQTANAEASYAEDRWAEYEKAFKAERARAQSAEAETARLSALLDQAREGNRSSRSEENSLAELGRPEDQSPAGWQDIASAPTDGTRVIMWGNGWDGPQTHAWATPARAAEELRHWHSPPLYWMPLPPPPAENGADERSPEGASAPAERDEPLLTRLSKTGGEGEEELSPSRTSPSSPDSRRPEALSDLEGELLAGADQYPELRMFLTGLSVRGGTMHVFKEQCDELAAELRQLLARAGGKS